MIPIDLHQPFGAEPQRQALIEPHRPTRLQEGEALGNAGLQSAAAQWTPTFLLRTQPVQAHRWPDFLQRLRKIYGDKVTSDSHALIDELRGDR